MKCELSAEARLLIVSLIYDKWSRAFDNLKYCKQRTITKEDIRLAGSKLDCEMMFVDQLRNAQLEFDKMQRILDEVIEYSPLIAGE